MRVDTALRSKLIRYLNEGLKASLELADLAKGQTDGVDREPILQHAQQLRDFIDWLEHDEVNPIVLHEKIADLEDKLRKKG
jgi:hypothetical protein